MTLFLILAFIAVLSAFGVIFNKNVVHSALSLLVNFSILAIFYFMLNAQFLGIAQILVYAGAIVVLFLFVIMLLGADLGEQVTSWITWQNGFFVILGLILVTVIGSAVREFPVLGARGDFSQEAVEEFGQTQVIARALFTEYIVPFQLVAVLLSIGVVGVVWLAQHQRQQKFRKVVAVLDATWAEETQDEGNDAQRVNWLQRQSVFDFDWIEIIQATDEEVEQFAMQVGNDTDDWRGSRYRQMPCLISPDCRLSENTVRALQELFGEVKIAKSLGSEL